MEKAERRRAQATYRRRLGVTLRRIRAELTTYSQATIAEELGVDVETVGRWERGAREPKAWELGLLAERYGIPADVVGWLLFPTDSLSELETRIEEIRIAKLRRAAAEAAQADVAAERSLRAVGGRSAPRGRSRA